MLLQTLTSPSRCWYADGIGFTRPLQHTHTHMRCAQYRCWLHSNFSIRTLISSRCCNVLNTHSLRTRKRVSGFVITWARGPHARTRWCQPPSRLAARARAPSTLHASAYDPSGLGPRRRLQQCLAHEPFDFLLFMKVVQAQPIHLRA